MHEVDLPEFERMVAEAVEALPPDFASRIENLDFAVEEWARPQDYAGMRTPRNATLLGVYRGVPLTRRGGYYNMTLPDTIVVFRQPLQRIAADAADLESRIARVVRHEIAHHFGISDARLHELDAY